MDPRQSKPKKQLTISIFNQLKKTDLLPQLVSSTTKPYDELEKYSKEHFHPHTLYGVLCEAPKDTFELFLYQKPNRKDCTIYKKKSLVTIDSKDEIIIENNPNLEKLILLKIDPTGTIQAINFYESIRQNKVAPMDQKNIYTHDHFIYLSLMNTKKAEMCYDGFRKELDKIQKEFNNPSYNSYFILLNESKSLDDALAKQLNSHQLIQKLKKGKIYFVVHSHCSAGSETISGEQPTSNDQWSMSVSELADLIIKFQIPEDSFLDIDLFSCSPGRDKSGVKESSFGSRLYLLLKKKFTNLSVKGNIYTTYSALDIVLCESPRDVAWFGTIREPLSSREQVEHSALLDHIASYPLLTIDDKPILNSVIQSLKNYALQLVKNDDLSFSYKQIYCILQEKLNGLEKFNATVDKYTKDSEQFIAENKNHNELLYRNIHLELLENINHLCQEIILNLNFEKALDSLQNIHKEHFLKLDYIQDIYKLKKRLEKTPRCFGFFFKSYEERIIAAAEKGTISFEEAWHKTSCKDSSDKKSLNTPLLKKTYPS